GVAITFAPASAFVRSGNRASILRHYIQQALQYRGMLVRLVLAAALLQMVGVVLPICTGLIVDRVVPLRDGNLLVAIGVLGAIAIGYQFSVSLLRGRLLINLRTQLDYAMTSSFFEHMMRLPLAYFQGRAGGDLLMRINSNSTVRDVLTNTILSSALD